VRRGGEEREKVSAGGTGSREGGFSIIEREKERKKERKREREREREREDDNGAMNEQEGKEGERRGTKCRGSSDLSPQF